MFPRPVFAGQAFPQEVFPSLGGALAQYISIIASLETLLNAVLPTTTTILPQPWPLLSAPMCFIVPGTQNNMQPQTTDAGRFYTGTEGNFTIKIVDQAYRGIAYSNASKLTDATYGILRTAHAAMQAVNYQIPLDQNDINIIEEPFVITSIESRKEYNGGAAWGINEFNVRARYGTEFMPETLPDNSTTLAIPSNLADVLLAIQALIQNLGIIPSQNVLLSNYEDPFPIFGSLFCTISLSTAITFEPDAYGTANYFTTTDTPVDINFIIRNILDIEGRADSLLVSPDDTIGLIALVAEIINGIQLAFPVNPSGAPVTEEPIWLEQIRAPRRYDEAGSYATIPTQWRVRWQSAMPNPIS